MKTEQIPVSFSGNIPKNYDSFLGPMYFEPYANDLAQRIKKLNPSKILEVAAGTGRLTRMLADSFSKEGLVATDINPAMVKYGQEHVPQVKWQQADAIALPFDDASFDCVVVQFGVMFYSDRVTAFREAWRVLKPGGTFLFNTWNELKANPPSYLAQQTLEHFFPVDTPAFFSVPYSYYDPETIRKDLEHAGFTNVQSELVKLKGPSESAASAAKGLLEGTPAYTAVVERDASKLPLIEKHLEEAIAEKFGNRNLQTTLEAWVVTAVKGN
jgi:ubiquinone/menaquinone biosynthesis C-methylase UbiE